MDAAESGFEIAVALSLHENMGFSENALLAHPALITSTGCSMVALQTAHEVFVDLLVLISNTCQTSIYT